MYDSNKINKYNETVVNCQRNVYKWQIANDINLCNYELNTYKLANDIIIPYDVVESLIVLYTIVI